jgi:hypothetical protein
VRLGRSSHGPPRQTGTAAAGGGAGGLAPRGAARGAQRAQQRAVSSGPRVAVRGTARRGSGEAAAGAAAGGGTGRGGLLRGASCAGLPACAQAAAAHDSGWAALRLRLRAPQPQPQGRVARYGCSAQAGGVPRGGTRRGAMEPTGGGGGGAGQPAQRLCGGACSCAPARRWGLRGGSWRPHRCSQPCGGRRLEALQAGGRSAGRPKGTRSRAALLQPEAARCCQRVAGGGLSSQPSPSATLVVSSDVNRGSLPTEGKAEVPASGRGRSQPWPGMVEFGSGCTGRCLRGAPAQLRCRRCRRCRRRRCAQRQQHGE